MTGEIDGELFVLVSSSGIQRLETIKNLRAGFMVQSLDIASGKIESTSVISIIPCVKKPLKIFTLEDGYQFKATDSSFLVVNGEGPNIKRADMILQGESLFLPSHLQKSESVNFVGKTRGRFEMNDMNLAFAGVCLGNRIMNHGNKIIPRNSWSLDKIVGHISSSGSSWTLKQRAKKGPYIRITGGIFKSVEKSISDFVPDYMYNVNYINQLSFLSGYFLSAGKIINHGEFYSAVCVVDNKTRPGILTIMKQLGMTTRLYNSEDISLIEIRHKSLKNIINIFKQYKEKSQNLKLSKIRSVVDYDGTIDIYSVQLSRGDALVTGECGVMYG